MSQPSPSTERRRRLHVVVRGRVQAVGFRQFVVRRAASMGLTGWVRNGDDGRSVEVEAEGPRADLERLFDRIREGPWGARVDRVEREWSDELRGYRSFEVRF